MPTDAASHCLPTATECTHTQYCFLACTCRCLRLDKVAVLEARVTLQHM